MDKTTKHAASEEREFKLLLTRNAAGALSVAASSSGAWASNISLGLSAEGIPTCTAVISPGPDMQQSAAEALLPDDERVEDEAPVNDVIEQVDEEESAAASAAVDERTAREAEEPDQADKADKPAEQLEGRPFEEIAKGAAKKVSDAKPAGSKQSSKPLSSNRQPSRTVTGSQQAAARR